jgi:hypothetical protein
VTNWKKELQFLIFIRRVAKLETAVYGVNGRYRNVRRTVSRTWLRLSASARSTSGLPIQLGRNLEWYGRASSGSGRPSRAKKPR